MRKPINWGLEYGFINSDGWLDMCWYAENGYKELPHFFAMMLRWMFRKNVYFVVNIWDNPFYLRNKYEPLTPTAKEGTHE